MKVKIGFEIHQQLNTKKLFCSCNSELTEAEPEATVVRRLRPTQSELGEIDRAAMQEFLKGRYYEYQIHNSNVCLVELDEEPPHLPNQEALEVALQVALLLNAEPVDEIHFMRKIVIDGSNTTGFQRTAIVAMNGYIDTPQGRVHIPTICLEEEAARKIEESSNRVVYRLDRLGIPLIEISTSPDITSPEQAKEVARIIGDVLRSTRKVKRGIGTIRQDINISIEGGARVEIKGVQELDMIPEIIKGEIERQKMLLEIKEELKNRASKEEQKLQIEDLTEIFKGSKSRVISRAIKNKGVVLGLKLRGFAGLLKGRLGPELATYARVKAGVKGIFHSDELPAYGISEKEVEDVNKALSLEEGDAFVIVAEKREKAEKALEAVFNRAILAFDGVVEETRVAKQDGTTVYMRPLPGAARMYPETDIPPIPVDESLLSRIGSQLPELIPEMAERFAESFGINSEQAYQIARSEYAELFERLASKYPKMAGFFASSLISTIKELRRQGYNVDNLMESDIEKTLDLVGRGKIPKEAVRQIFADLTQGKKLEQVLEAQQVSEEELRKMIRQIIRERKDFVMERGEKAEKPLMGVVMAKLRGKVSGSLVNRILREELEEFLRG